MVRSNVEGLSSETVEGVAEDVFTGREVSRPDDIELWPSKKTIHYGRDERNHLHLGVEDSVAEEGDSEFGRYILAHELGHDLHDTAFNSIDNPIKSERVIEGGSFYINRESNPERFGYQNIEQGILTELIAELTAKENTELQDPFERDPFQDVDKLVDSVKSYETGGFYAEKGDEIIDEIESYDIGTREFTDLVDRLPKTHYEEGGVFNARNEDDEKEFGIRPFVDNKGDFKGVNYDKEGDTYLHFQALSGHLDFLQELNSAVREDEIDIKDVIKLGWSRGVTDYRLDDETNVLFEQVDERLGEFDYEEINSFRTFEENEDVDQVIGENLEGIISSTVEEHVEEFAERIENIADTYTGLKPSPNHLTTEASRNEIYDSVTFDYNHNIGCSLGIMLHERGVTVDEVIGNAGTYTELVRSVTGEVTRIGLQYDKTPGLEPEKEDFKQAVDYIIEDKEI